MEILMPSRLTEHPLLTTSQAAELLALAPQTLHNWRVTGRGPPFYKVHGAVRYDLAELQTFLDERRHGEASSK